MMDEVWLRCFYSAYLHLYTSNASNTLRRMVHNMCHVTMGDLWKQVCAIRNTLAVKIEEKHQNPRWRRRNDNAPAFHVRTLPAWTCCVEGATYTTLSRSYFPLQLDFLHYLSLSMLASLPHGMFFLCNQLFSFSLHLSLSLYLSLSISHLSRSFSVLSFNCISRSLFISLSVSLTLHLVSLSFCTIALSLPLSGYLHSPSPLPHSFSLSLCLSLSLPLYLLSPSSLTVLSKVLRFTSKLETDTIRTTINIRVAENWITNDENQLKKV